MGINFEEKPDGMVIEGGAAVGGGVEVDSFGDHRIAMALSVLALFASEEVVVKNVGCVDTSYPTFWSDLDLICSKT